MGEVGRDFYYVCVLLTREIVMKSHLTPGDTNDVAVNMGIDLGPGKGGEGWRLGWYRCGSPQFSRARSEFGFDCGMYVE